MDSAHFRVLIHKLLNKDQDKFPEESLLIILDSKSAVCMAKTCKDTKHIRHIAIRVQFSKEWQKLKYSQD